MGKVHCYEPVQWVKFIGLFHILFNTFGFSFYGSNFLLEISRLKKQKLDLTDAQLPHRNIRIADTAEYSMLFVMSFIVFLTSAILGIALLRVKLAKQSFCIYGCIFGAFQSIDWSSCCTVLIPNVLTISWMMFSLVAYALEIWLCILVIAEMQKDLLFRQKEFQHEQGNEKRTRSREKINSGTKLITKPQPLTYSHIRYHNINQV